MKMYMRGAARHPGYGVGASRVPNLSAFQTWAVRSPQVHNSVSHGSHHARGLQRECDEACGTVGEPKGFPAHGRALSIAEHPHGCDACIRRAPRLARGR